MSTFPRVACMVAALGLLAASALAQPPGAAQKQTFRWNFREDDRFQMETTTDVKQVIRVTGQEEVRQEQSYTLLCTYTVKQKDSENTVLEQKIEDVKVKLPTGVAAGKFYQQLKGSVLRLTLNKNHELTRLEGYEEMLRQVSGDDPGVRRVIQAVLPEETLRRAIEASFSFLPTDEVGPGDRWQRKYTASLGPIGSLDVVNNYVYEKMESEGGETTHRFGVQPEIAYSLPKTDTTGLPFQVVGGDLRAEAAEGSLSWDSTKGKLVRSDLRLKLVGNLKLKTKEQEADMTLENEQIVEIRMVKPTN